MFNRRNILVSIIASTALSITVSASSFASEKLPVVASFSVLGDMVKRIGGEHIALKTLVGPDGDAHVYQPTPADARSVKAAKLFIVNGLEFEGWLDRLIESSEFKGERIIATKGIEALPFEEEEHHDDAHDKENHHDDKHAEDKHNEDKHGEDKHEKHHDKHEGEEHAEDEHGHHHGTYDPHAWQSLKLAVAYVDNITAALATAKPEHAASFYKNRSDYVAEIKSLDQEIQDLIAALPESRRVVITSHDAFGYFAHQYGLKFEAPQGLSTESEPSAADVAKIIRQIREHGISGVFVESITDNRLLEQIANETNATIGGTLYSDALSGKDGPASTYLKMMKHNATTITKALGSS